MHEGSNIHLETNNFTQRDILHLDVFEQRHICTEGHFCAMDHFCTRVKKNKYNKKKSKTLYNPIR